jgi:hypothetical protein
VPTAHSDLSSFAGFSVSAASQPSQPELLLLRRRRPHRRPRLQRRRRQLGLEPGTDVMFKKKNIFAAKFFEKYWHFLLKPPRVLAKNLS